MPECVNQQFSTTPIYIEQKSENSAFQQEQSCVQRFGRWLITPLPPSRTTKVLQLLCGTVILADVSTTSYLSFFNSECPNLENDMISCALKGFGNLKEEKECYKALFLKIDQCKHYATQMTIMSVGLGILLSGSFILVYQYLKTPAINQHEEKQKAISLKV